MGNSNVAGYSRDILISESFRDDCNVTEKITNQAFDKCIDKTTMGADHKLTRNEAACIQEYTILYSGFLRSTSQQFQQQYEVYGREMQRKAQMMQMQQQQQQGQ